MRLIYSTNKGALVMTGRLIGSPRMILLGWVKIPNNRLSDTPLEKEITNDGRLINIKWSDGSSEVYKITMNQPITNKQLSYNNK